MHQSSVSKFKLLVLFTTAANLLKDALTLPAPLHPFDSLK